MLRSSEGVGVWRSTAAGVSALQEAGWLPVNQLAGFVRIEILGVYPTIQGIADQVATAVLLIGFRYNQRRVPADGKDSRR